MCLTWVVTVDGLTSQNVMPVDGEGLPGKALKKRWCLSLFLKAGRVEMEERWPKDDKTYSDHNILIFYISTIVANLYDIAVEAVVQIWNKTVDLYIEVNLLYCYRCVLVCFEFFTGSIRAKFICCCIEVVKIFCDLMIRKTVLQRWETILNLPTYDWAWNWMIFVQLLCRSVTDKRLKKARTTKTCRTVAHRRMTSWSLKKQSRRVSYKPKLFTISGENFSKTYDKLK